MPALVVPSRRSLSSADEDEASEIRHSSDESTLTSSASNKRAKVSNAQSRRSTTDSWHLETPQTAARSTKASGANPTVHLSPSASLATRPNPRSQRPHQPGSLVRIYLKNFVTYSSAFFEPGPALNMVIGPNGTGKSTLVCAICLGLGWGTQHLGRAKEVCEFVKHGREEASIEIELQGRPGQTNPVIRRQINKDNSSKWWLNGRLTTQKSVTSLARDLNIQIDNLCQFLPQDRVVEFAALSPVDRLTQTVRATAPDYMIQYHDRLKELRSEQKALQSEQSTAKDSLTNLEGRQNQQHADVERFREREKLTRDIKVLEAFKPVAEMNMADFEWNKAKERTVETRQELYRLEAEVAPSLDALKRKKTYTEKISDVLTRRKDLFTNFERRVHDSDKKIDALAAKVKECEQRRKAEHSTNKERSKRIEDIERKLRQVKSQMENAPPNFDPAEYNERSRDVTRRVREIQDKINELEQEWHSLNTESTQKQKRRDDAAKEIESLRSRIGQQMSTLKKESSDAYTAWEWIQQNKGQFEGSIYGPPIVECSIKDERLVKPIESIFQRSELLAITCTNDRDRDKLLNQLIKVMKLSEVTVRNIRTPLSDYSPPVSEERKQQLGIDGWVLDYISGPEPVLAMLCSERCRLNRTALFNSNDISEQRFNQLQENNIESWVTLTANYRVTKRHEYGASSTSVSQHRDPRIWTKQPVDTYQEGDLRDNIAGWESEVQELKEKKQQNETKRKDLRRKEVELAKEGQNIDEEKAELQRATSTFNALPNKLSGLERQLATEEVEKTRLQVRLDDIAAEEMTYTIQKGQAAIDHSNLVEQLRRLHVQTIEAAVAHLEASSDVAYLEHRSRHVTETLGAKKNELAELKEDERQKNTACKRLRREIKEHSERDPELWDRIAELSVEETSRTPEELTIAIENIRSRLGLLHGGDANMIKQFEERAKKIERLKTLLVGMDEKLIELSAQIIEIRSKWEPELDTLVDQISDAFGESFRKINCAGEVRVHKDGENGIDFDNWAIIIKVKFREEEEMSALDSHRQSGGERAVSTIFYLMALQSLSKAPFRVVDEINQGMDPRNERIVHERMVDIACGNDEDDDPTTAYTQNSQYFLVTPKLLPGLKYSPGMKVHCIVSGEYMPDNPSDLDLGKLVQNAKKKLKPSSHSPHSSLPQR